MFNQLNLHFTQYPLASFLKGQHELQKELLPNSEPPFPWQSKPEVHLNRAPTNEICADPVFFPQNFFRCSVIFKTGAPIGPNNINFESLTSNTVN